MADGAHAGVGVMGLSKFWRAERMSAWTRATGGATNANGAPGGRDDAVAASDTAVGALGFAGMKPVCGLHG